MAPLLISTSAFSSLRESGLLPALDRECQQLGISSARTLLEKALIKAHTTSPRPNFTQQLENEMPDLPREEEYQSVLLRHGVTLSRFLLPDLHLEQHRSPVPEAATLYAASESQTHKPRDSEWSWRADNRVSRISCPTHGDVAFSQYVIAEQNLLFPEVLASEVASLGFSLNQEAAPLLVSVLLYAAASGATDIPELQNYRDIIRNERANPWGMPDVDAPADESALEDAERYFEDRLFGCDNCPDATHAFRFGSRAGNIIFPRNNNGVLEFLCSDTRGEIVDARLGDRRWSSAGTLTASEIGDALRGIYRAYARSTREMMGILEYFKDFAGLR